MLQKKWFSDETRRSLETFITTWWGWFAALVIALTVLSAWCLRFVQDDAFISFRYADHLARGLGLVWNPGEPIEGYTNFLWVLLLSIPHRLGIDPISFSYAIGLVCTIGTMLCALFIARHLLRSRVWALVTISALGMSFSFRGFTTGGLETSLQTLLLTAGVACALKISVTRHPGLWTVVYSVIASAAVLTRLDAVVAFALPTVFLVVYWFRTARSRLPFFLFLLLLPAALLLVPWLGWKLSYYGSLLPNTYGAKARVRFFEGASYVGMFFLVSILFPFMIALFFDIRKILRQQPAATFILFTIALWIAYVIAIGGDFIEFRFLVPILPLLMLAFALHFRFVRRGFLIWTLAVGFVLLGSLFQGHVYNISKSGSVSTIRDLKNQLEKDRLIDVGKALRPLASIDPPVVIATMAAGAIPYYATLPTIDMFGLNDPWVLAHGHRVSGKPGHERVAPLSYLEARKVTLAFAYPSIIAFHPNEKDVQEKIRSALQEDQKETRTRLLCWCETEPIPKNARILLLPLSESELVPLLYLTDHPGLNKFADEHGWVRFPLYPETIEGSRSAPPVPDLAVTSLSR